MISEHPKSGQPPLGVSTVVLVRPEVLGNRMEEWEYCLLWASPRKTVIIKSGGQMEKFTKKSRNRGILTNLQADGWQTVAFNIEPTVDMTYLFKRSVQTQEMAERDRPLSDVPIYPHTRIPYQEANTFICFDLGSL
jgi:hypothetical protein